MPWLACQTAHPCRPCPVTRADARRVPAITLKAAALVLLSLCCFGKAQAQTDSRIVVLLPKEDRERMREDMREFLKQTSDLLNAVADRNMRRVQEVASKARPPLPRIRALAAGTAPVPPILGNNTDLARRPAGERERALFVRMQNNLPLAFRGMLLGMREGVAEIERDALAVGDPQHTLRQIASVQSLCVACHGVYQVRSKTGAGGS